MRTPNAEIIRTHTFSHKSIIYDVVAFVEPADSFTVRVDVTSNGQPVVITYPDTYQATHGYSVTLETRFDILKDTGIDAISDLMQIAEDDIKRFH